MTAPALKHYDDLHRQRIRLAAGVIKSVVRIPDYQIRIAPSSPFHRVGCIEGETACGKPIPENGRRSRDYLLDDQLCTDGCFSPHELELGRRAVCEPDPE